MFSSFSTSLSLSRYDKPPPVIPIVLDPNLIHYLTFDKLYDASGNLSGSGGYVANTADGTVGYLYGVNGTTCRPE